MNLLKRMLATCGFSALAAVGVATGAAQAQDYPTRNITMIVPFAAGGPTDVIARIVTGHMQQTLGQTIVIENVVGAGGTTASTRAARKLRLMVTR
jgi:tripartite-type tricarboxylate transporter receptor subunit TctC